MYSKNISKAKLRSYKHNKLLLISAITMSIFCTLDAISKHEEFSKIRTHVPDYNTQPDFEDDDDEWEDLDDEEELELP